MTTPRKATEKFDPDQANARALAGDYDQREIPSGLADALLAFQAEMPTVGKTNTATVKSDKGSYKYTYANLADVSKQIVPLLVKHGLTFTCLPSRCENGNYELIGVLRHTSGESDTGSLPLMGRTAQEIGSSITYARRYLLGCMTGVVTDDDDDGKAGSQTAQPTSHPSPIEVAQQRLTQAWTLHNRKPWDLAAASIDYGEWSGKQLAQASPADLDQFSEHLDQQRATRGAEEAAGAAQRGLGAQPVEEQMGERA